MLHSINKTIFTKGFFQYFHNTSWLFVERIFKMILSLFIGVWVARYLGPNKFGLFSYALSFIGLFSTIATLGLDGIAVREIVKNPLNKDQILGTIFILKIYGFVITFLFLLIGIHFTSNNLYTNQLIFIIASSIIFQSFNVIDLYFQAIVKSKNIALLNICTACISAILKIYFILNHATLTCFAWIIVFENFLLSIGFISLYLTHKQSIIKWRFKTCLALNLLKDSWPLIISGVVISIYMKIDQIMIKELLGNNAVGNYAVAVRLSECWYFIPMIIGSSLFPAIINSQKINNKLYRERLQYLYNLMIYIAIFISLIMTVFGDTLISFLYDNKFNQATSVLKIHTWATIFVFIGVINSKRLLNENLQQFTTINTSIGMLLNIILNYILIQKMGITGAAWATLIAYFVAAYLSLSLWKPTRKSFFDLTQCLFLYTLFIKCKNNE